MAAVTRSFSPLITGPCVLRSSGVIAPSVFSSADTEPLLPSADTRTDSKRRLVLGGGDGGENFLFKLCDVGHGFTIPVMARA